MALIAFLRLYAMDHRDPSRTASLAEDIYPLGLLYPSPSGVPCITASLHEGRYNMDLHQRHAKRGREALPYLFCRLVSGALSMSVRV